MSMSLISTFNSSFHNYINTTPEPGPTIQTSYLGFGKQFVIRNITPEVNAIFSMTYYAQRLYMLEKDTGFSTKIVDTIEGYLGDRPELSRYDGATARKPKIESLPLPVRVHSVASSFFHFRQPQYVEAIDDIYEDSDDDTIGSSSTSSMSSSRQISTLTPATNSADSDDFGGSFDKTDIVASPFLRKNVQSSSSASESSSSSPALPPLQFSQEFTDAFFRKLDAFFRELVQSSSSASESSSSSPCIGSLARSALPPLKFSQEFDCSENNLNENIVHVATFVSKTYACFPKIGNEQRNLLRKEGFLFGDVVDFPSFKECTAFEIALKQKIIEIFNNKLEKGKGFSYDLRTHNRPEKDFGVVAESIFPMPKYQISDLFPYKTHTCITLNKNRTQLILTMDFKGVAW